MLIQSKHHPLHLPWIMRMRQQMPPALKAEVSAFGIIFWQVIPDIFANPFQLTSDFPTFEEELRATQALSASDYATRVINQSILGYKGEAPEYSFEHILHSREIQQQVLTRTTSLYPASLEMVEELLTHPEQSQKRFLAFFSWYWETCMVSDWPDLENLLLSDIQQRGQILFEQGPREMLDSLAPQLSVFQQDENTITMYYPSRQQREMRAGELLFLIPSAYVWPRLSFIYEQDTLIALVYSIKLFQEEGHAPVPPERLLKLLRAAGDMTRLQILQLLSQRPRSTQELAGILSLSEAGISKHVKILQDAGFLKSERSSYYVLYQSLRDPLAEITRGLDMILQPPAHE